jgi:hypothetical protein
MFEDLYPWSENRGQKNLVGTRQGRLKVNLDVHFRFQSKNLIAIIGTDQARNVFQKMAANYDLMRD